MRTGNDAVLPGQRHDEGELDSNDVTASVSPEIDLEIVGWQTQSVHQRL